MESEFRTSLPDDILLEILSSLGGARAIARCRCVCKAWRALVDAHGLLLLPRALSRDALFPGFFANTVLHKDPGPMFLSPPSTRAAPKVDMLDFLRPHLPLSSSRAAVCDHCNGLVLCFQEDAGFVCNPATKRWARLPRPPTALARDQDGLFLAFDPAVSPQYQVFLLPAAPAPNLLVRSAMVIMGKIIPGSGEQLERLFITKREREEKAVPVLVFSSEDGRWTRRVFAAGRRSPGHLYDRAMAPNQRQRTWRSAAYRRGSLYVQTESRVLVALRCSEGTYDMVELPGDATGAAIGSMSAFPRDSIFLSPDLETGGALRYASVNKCRVKVWGLREPADHVPQLEWTLILDKDLEPYLYVLAIQHLTCGWRWPYQADAGNSWDEAMDRGGVLDVEPDEERLHALGYRPGFSPWNSIAILGFHPSREVIVFATESSLLVAYDLVSSKLRYLGSGTLRNRRVERVFPYSPCFVDALPLPSFYPPTMAHFQRH